MNEALTRLIAEKAISEKEKEENLKAIELLLKHSAAYETMPKLSRLAIDFSFKYQTPS